MKTGSTLKKRIICFAAAAFFIAGIFSGFGCSKSGKLSGEWTTTMSFREALNLPFASEDETTVRVKNENALLDMSLSCLGSGVCRFRLNQYEYKGTLNDRYYAMLVGLGVAAEDRFGDGSKTWKDGENSEYNPIISVGDEWMKENDGETFRVREAWVDYVKFIGFEYLQVSAEDLQSINDWQEKTGIQVIYPLIDTKSNYCYDHTDADVWYAVKRGYPVDENGNEMTLEDVMQKGFTDLYLRDANGEAVFVKTLGSMYQIRVLFSNYSQYLRSKETDPANAADGITATIDFSKRPEYWIYNCDYENCEVECTMKFDPDGTYTIEYDKAFAEMIANVTVQACANDNLKWSYGYDPRINFRSLAEKFGVYSYEAIHGMLIEQLDGSNGGSKIEGKYLCKDGKLYLSDSTDTKATADLPALRYSLKGDTLELKLDSDKAAEYYNEEFFPIELKKKK